MAKKFVKLYIALFVGGDRYTLSSLGCSLLFYKTKKSAVLDSMYGGKKGIKAE